MKRWNCPVSNLRVLVHRFGAGMLFLTLASPLWAGSGPQLVSVRDAAAPLPFAGNGYSVAPWMSADGRFLVFSSGASDLVTNDNGYLGPDVFLFDRASNATVLVSANLSNTGGGNGSSTYGMVSTNGRYAVFESLASDLAPGDTNETSDIFVRDLLTKTTALVSVSASGFSGNRSSSDAAMTPNGRYVAFVSVANNLVSVDTNGIPDVFLRDVVGGTTTLVSVGATNITSALATTFMSPPAITPDGRYVAFSSNARGLAPGIPSAPVGEIYLRDVVGGTTIWVSTNAGAIVTNALNSATATALSSQPSISDDGRYVAFKVTGSFPGRSQTFILQFDTIAATTTLISTNGMVPFNSQNDDTYGPEMSPDGRFVTYSAIQFNTNTIVIQQWDASTGTNVLVSASLSGDVPTNSISHAAKASPDGRFVAFVSSASNLVANAVSTGYHVYLRDVQSGATQLVDVNTNGIGAADDWGTVPFLSTNGQFVAFCSLDASLVASDDNNAYDIFVRDAVGASTELISRRTASANAGNALSSGGPFTISADGRWVAFTSFASDLVTNDFNNERDVFVRDLQTGSNILVSVGLDGNAGLGGNSVTPVISANGRYVAFASLATNLVANDTNRAADIFRRDLQTGTTILVNVNSGGASLATNDASAPVISANGRYMAFLNFTNPTTMPATFWRDIVSGTTTMLAVASPIAPSMSGDGQRVAFFNSSSIVFVWDALLGANIYSNTAVASAAISPSGSELLFQNASRQLFVRDLPGLTNRFIAGGAVTIRSSAQWSDDGRFFTFATVSNLVAGDANFTNDVYLYDVQTGTLTLVSVNSAGTASANGESDWPVISANGRFVVYRTYATDIVGVLNPPSLVAFDRFTGTTSLLEGGTPNSGWTSWISHPAIDGSAGTVVFLSWDSGVVSGDRNRASDIFSQAVTVLPGTDSDGDGIPDWWTQQHFGHPTGQVGDLSRADDDSDGDGTSNLEEYLAGTVPTDPNSILALKISAFTAPGANVLLTWPTVPGRSYQVQYKDNLTDPSWSNITGGVIVMGNQGRFIAPANSAGRYFQVVVVN
jgi:WD40-like Beta Propeller Repeat